MTDRPVLSLVPPAAAEPLLPALTAERALELIARELELPADVGAVDVVAAVSLLRHERAADEFWKDVYPRGIPETKVRDELRDFAYIIDQLPLVYQHVTGNRLSKHTYSAETVIAVHDEHVNELLNDALQDTFEPIAELLGLPHDDGTTAAELETAIRLLLARAGLPLPAARGVHPSEDSNNGEETSHAT